MESSVFIAIGYIIFGLILLTFGGDKLVDGAISIAKKLKVSEAIIGLTIVAIGTSMPELIVSLLAAINGNTEIAIGNVLGSNVANVFLILGMTIAISPIVLSNTMRKFDIPVLVLVTLLLLLISSDKLLEGGSNTIGRIDGIILVTFAILYIVYSIKHNNTQTEESIGDKGISSLRSIFLIVLGVALLFTGGKILVTGAVDLAMMAGLSESIIGLTIVAIGTSTPEMITSIIAARRGNSAIAVGNIVGSNIMNILVILGISAAIAPLPFLSTSYIDLFVSLLAPFALLVLAQKSGKIGKSGGFILLAVYLAYLAYLITKEIM